MTQSAFKVDQLQIEPGLPGNRVLRADPDTGALTFYDPSAAAGVSLARVSGIAVDQLFLVGKSGPGAAYTSVKDALDAARAARLHATSPNTGTFLILVLPGDYEEAGSLVVDFDDVFIQGFGGSVALSVDADVFHVKEYSAGAATLYPQRVGISGLRIVNGSATGKACVFVEGGAGSKVGLDGIVLDRVDWETSGSGIAVKATSANHVKMTGGSMKDCAGGGNQVQVDTCASFEAEGVLDGKNFQLDFDTAHDLPEEGSSSVYRIKSSTLAYLTSTLANRGALELQACDGTFDTVFAGTQKAHALGCRFRDVTLSGTAQMALPGTTYRTLSLGAGTAAAEPVQVGFNAALPATETTVVVAIPRQPDTDYNVFVSMTGAFAPTTWRITARTTTTFTVEFTTADAVNARSFDWTVLRTVKNL